VEIGGEQRALTGHCHAENKKVGKLQGMHRPM
jgi:hypothetical protein